MHTVQGVCYWCGREVEELLTTPKSHAVKGLLASPVSPAWTATLNSCPFHFTQSVLMMSAI